MTAKKVKPATGASKDVLEAMVDFGRLDEASAGRLPINCGANLANRLHCRGWIERNGPKCWVTAEGRAALDAAKAVA